MSRVSMAVNATLAVVKQLVAIAGPSFPLIADTVESLSNIVGPMTGGWWGQRLVLCGDFAQLRTGAG